MSYAGRDHFRKIHQQRENKKKKKHKVFRQPPHQYEEKGDYVFRPFRYVDDR